MMGQSETSGQHFSRWFTEYPATHVEAGKTVEVIAVSALAEEHSVASRLGSPSESLAASGRSVGAHPMTVSQSGDRTETTDLQGAR
jgi:hypothetical protein